ncbi:hypothetical protein N1851_008101 [Merluccius polli]|uniref:Uncharacterized protein n=1 Tax=Merluccius polli TaxID=89951 RepID=A0AA47N348_MERPO|nr:hypothetical protein N1851_008101 [Merluccius polli]
MPTAPPVLPDQVPSDPEEPFFILSLTEIPTFPPEEGSEPRPYLPVTDSALQTQSDPATPAGSSSGRSASLCLHRGPTSTQECTDDAGSLCTQTAHGIEKPEDQPDPAPVHRAELLEAVGGSLVVEPPSKKRRASSVTRQKNHAASPPAAELSEAVAHTVEDEDPPSKKRRGPGPGQKAKSEVQPKCTGKRQTRGTSAVKELTAEAEKGSIDSLLLLQAEQGTHTQEKADTAASSQPIDTQSSDDVTRPPETPLKRPGRKPKGFLSFLSDKPTPGPSGSPGSKVKASPLAPRVKMPSGAARRPGPTKHAARQTPLKEVSVAAERRPAGITSVAPASLAAGSAEPRPSSSGCTVKMADDHSNDKLDVSLEEEEPTNISQYFLSDIFTEVDE